MGKTKVHLEFDMKHTPVALLWEFISTAPGLAKWFADKVEVEGKEYTFYWEKLPQTALLTALRAESHIRLRWDDEDPASAHTYFEMRINTTDLTDHVSLAVTDFADPGEEEEIARLWKSQVDVLKRVIGC